MANWVERMQGWRHWLAQREVYRSIAQSTTLQDVSDRLQVVFAAGMATLGLVLNRPAAILGVVLLSSLRGPILGFGLGLALTQGGGGLVFLALPLDTAPVQKSMEQASESCRVQRFLGRYEVLRRLKPLGSLWGRGLAVVVGMGALWVPLSRSFARLNAEITTRRRNEVAQFPDGRLRGTLDRLAVREREGRSVVWLVAGTVQGYAAERLALLEALFLLDGGLIALPTMVDQGLRPTLGAPNWVELRRDLVALQRLTLPPTARLVDCGPPQRRCDRLAGAGGDATVAGGKPRCLVCASRRFDWAWEAGSRGRFGLLQPPRLAIGATSQWGLG